MQTAAKLIKNTVVDLEVTPRSREYHKVVILLVSGLGVIIRIDMSRYTSTTQHLGMARRVTASHDKSRRGDTRAPFQNLASERPVYRKYMHETITP